ncbi:MAG: sigma-54 dependent transcriptional regulator [Vicinamibacterales bacterium]
MDVRWIGLPPTPVLRESLMAAGHRIVGGPMPADHVTIVCTPARQPPEPPCPGPWIWAFEGGASDLAMRTVVAAGAYDAIALDHADAVHRLAARLDELAVADDTPETSATLVTESEASKHVLRQVHQVASTSMPVLLTGETGTGKEVVARLIHARSPRHAGRFVPVNCAAIPNELMESELFGFARGAFSGAVQGYDGQLMAAEGGTVFLDEIDDTPASIQVKLLRVLEDHVVSRLGENTWRRVDFRLVAATNRDLQPLIDDGRFGSDLYQRLAIVSIHLRPLRERLEDLPPLVDHFLAKVADELPERGMRVRTVRPEVIRALAAYPWPGNVRELRNVLFQALVYKRGGDELLLSDLPRRILQRPTGPPPRVAIDLTPLKTLLLDGRLNLRATIEDVERYAVREAVAAASGNVARAARLLGVVGRGRAKDPGGTLRSMIRRLGLDDREPDTNVATPVDTRRGG